MSPHARPNFDKQQITEFLAKNGYRTHPMGIIEHYPVDWTLESEVVAFLDINAEAVRKGDVVPDRPIRITARLENLGGDFGQWRMESAEELRAGIKSRSLDREPETPRVSPSWSDVKKRPD
jgi:hypothetical protein